MTQVPPIPAPSSRPDTNKPDRRDVPARPNIVLVLCDDLGFSDVGPFGSEIPTPHLDALAASGVRMTQMYNAARCCPSRASLLTGTYPTQADVGHMTETGAFFDQDGYRGRLGERVVTFAEALGAAGYRTAMVGKWHVGGPLGADAYGFDPERHALPWRRGFERFFGTLLGAGSYFAPEGLLDGELPFDVDDGFYYTDATADRACAAVDHLAPGADPFVLYVAHTAPHWPLHAPEEDVGSTAYGGTMAVCAVTDLFAAVARAAGPDLTRRRFVDAAGTVGPLELPYGGPASLAPGKPDAADALRPLVWAARCTCWLPVGGYVRVP